MSRSVSVRRPWPSALLLALLLPLPVVAQQCPGYPKSGMPGCNINLSVTRNWDDTLTIGPGGSFAGVGGMVIYFAGLAHNPDPFPVPQAAMLDPIFGRPCCQGGLVWLPSSAFVVGGSGQAPLTTGPVPRIPGLEQLVMFQGVIFRPTYTFTPCDYYLTNACCFPTW